MRVEARNSASVSEALFARLCHRTWVAPCAILLMALALRLYHVDYQSVWNDEAFSIIVSALPPGPMMDGLIQDFVHPPLHYYLLHGWFGLVGYGALQARLLSVVFGSLSVLMIYVLGEYLYDRRTGLLAALLLAVSQLGVLYSQEARPYAQFFFFVLTSIYWFIRMLRERRAAFGWCFLLSATVLIYTHYYGSLVLLCLILFAVTQRKRYTLHPAWWAGGACLMAALYAPWLLSGVIPEALHHSGAMPPGLKAYFSARWWSLFAAINWFNNGKWSGVNASPPWWTFPAGGILFTLPALVSLKPFFRRSSASPAERKERDGALLLTLVWLLPMIAMFGLGLLGFRYNVRHITFCMLPYYLLAAHGLSNATPGSFRALSVVLILLYSACALRASYFVPYKENYRQALAYVASEYRSNDCLVFIPGNRVSAARMSWDVYHRGHPLTITNFSSVRSGQAHCGRVWLIRDYWSLESLPYARDEAASEIDAALSRTDERSYSGITAGLYVPRPR